jgi:hypothetical protein
MGGTVGICSERIRPSVHLASLVLLHLPTTLYTPRKMCSEIECDTREGDDSVMDCWFGTG